MSKDAINAGNETSYLSWEKPLELQVGNPIPPKKKFDLGRTVITQGVQGWIDKVAESRDILSVASVLQNCLLRHQSGDWGDMDDHDKKANDEALEHGNRIFSGYDLSSYDPMAEKLWVITEWDRSVTTLLFPSEY